MTKIPTPIIDRFASAFAGSGPPKSGMALDQISDYFRRYNPNCPDGRDDAFRPKRTDHFVNCLSCLSVTEQKPALMELCNEPPKMRWGVPSEALRTSLRDGLLQGDRRVPIGPKLGSLNLPIILDRWCESIYRLPTAPKSSITASRTLLEQVCLEILEERQFASLDKMQGDLGKMLKSVCQILGLDQKKRQLSSGIATIVNSIAGLSNSDGDRHATVGKSSLEAGDNIALDAELVSNLCGALTVYLWKYHSTS